MKTAWVVGGLAALAFAWLFRGLLLPLFLAVTLAYLLNPLVVRAEAAGVRRSVAVAALYLAILLLVVGGGYGLGPRVRAEVATLAQRLPAMASQVDRALERARVELAEALPVLRRFLPQELRAGPQEGPATRLIEGREARLSETLEHAGHAFLMAVLVPFFAFFLLRDSRWLTAVVMDRLPPRHVETSVAVWCEIDAIIGRYIRGVALDGLVMGTLAALSLWALGVPYPLLLGLVAGLANTIPFIGPLLSGAAAGLVVLTAGQGLAGVGRVALVFLVLKVLDDTVIQPLTIGRSVHLHPMLLLASVVAGNEALGILGMIVAVPLVTVLQETLRLLLEHHRALTRRVTSGEPPAPAHLVC
jgi:predicted PurR-regulated permease PerM